METIENEIIWPTLAKACIEWCLYNTVITLRAINYNKVWNKEKYKWGNIQNVKRLVMAVTEIKIILITIDFWWSHRIEQHVIDTNVGKQLYYTATDV